MLKIAIKIILALLLIFTIRSAQADQIRVYVDTTGSTEMGITEWQARSSVIHCLRLWDIHSKHSFKIVNDPEAQVTFRFQPDNKQYLGVWIERNRFKGIVSINTKYKLTRCELGEVLLHEIGHILGLRHNEHEDSIMGTGELTGTCTRVPKADVKALKEIEKS